MPQLCQRLAYLHHLNAIGSIGWHVGRCDNGDSHADPSTRIAWRSAFLRPDNPSRVIAPIDRMKNRLSAAACMTAPNLGTSRNIKTILITPATAAAISGECGRPKA